MGSGPHAAEGPLPDQKEDGRGKLGLGETGPDAQGPGGMKSAFPVDPNWPLGVGPGRQCHD